MFILCFVLVETRDECARVFRLFVKRLKRLCYVTLFELMAKEKERLGKREKTNSIRTRRERVTDNNNKI